MWNILVVDDNFLNRKLILEILKNKAVCDSAASVQEAIEAYKLSCQQNKPYDMVLLDIAMPEVSGIEFLKYVREDERKKGILLGKGVLIIMVTAYKEHFLKSFDFGCDDYILKPITSDVLMTKVEKYLSGK
ncbi:MAG TPA: hypothetical protein DCL35_07150 [Candidatus Omnitrophica bacterium]|nr:hypothetical protein [Candidatus Omnitrophota bacterium]